MWYNCRLYKNQLDNLYNNARLVPIWAQQCGEYETQWEFWQDIGP